MASEELTPHSAGGILPNFLIIGAARSGTTTLFSLLRQHPEVYLPEHKRPEPHFFLKDAEYEKGPDYYSARYFAGWQGEPAIGEASTSYLFDENAPRRIARHLPDVRLVALLRNPVDRAYSSYWNTVRSGLEWLPFEQAIEGERERTARLEDEFLREVRPFAYLERSSYVGQIRRYHEFFAPSQLLWLFFDDLTSNIRLLLRRTFAFLDVAEEFEPRPRERIENRSTPAYRAMSPRTRSRLVERFRPEIEEVARILDRDLTAWLR